MFVLDHAMTLIRKRVLGEIVWIRRSDERLLVFESSVNMILEHILWQAIYPSGSTSQEAKPSRNSYSI